MPGLNIEVRNPAQGADEQPRLAGPPRPAQHQVLLPIPITQELKELGVGGNVLAGIAVEGEGEWARRDTGSGEDRTRRSHDALGINGSPACAETAGHVEPAHGDAGVAAIVARAGECGPRRFLLAPIFLLAFALAFTDASYLSLQRAGLSRGQQRLHTAHAVA